MSQLIPETCQAIYEVMKDEYVKVIVMWRKHVTVRKRGTYVVAIGPAVQKIPYRGQK